MTSATWMPANQSPRQVASGIVFAKHPAFASMSPLAKRFDLPTGRFADYRLNLRRPFACEETRIPQDVIDGRKLISDPN